MKDDIETKLSALKIKAPSEDYVRRGQQILESYASQPKSINRTWVFALAAALMVSIGLNVFQYHNSTGFDTGLGISEKSLASDSDAQKEMGGYSIVQTDASPLGEQQNIKIVWGDSI